MVSANSSASCTSTEASLRYLAKIGKVSCVQMRRCSAIVAPRAVEMPPDPDVV
jgi:hypothetical protein